MIANQFDALDLVVRSAPTPPHCPLPTRIAATFWSAVVTWVFWEWERGEDGLVRRVYTYHAASFLGSTPIPEPDPKYLDLSVMISDQPNLICISPEKWSRLFTNAIENYNWQAQSRRECRERLWL